jgi:hypothetical protein
MGNHDFKIKFLVVLLMAIAAAAAPGTKTAEQ